MAEQYNVLEKKYKTLKKKSKVIQEENVTLANSLEKIKLKAIRLQKERSFLLDRLLRYEDASDEDVTSSNTDEEEETSTITNNTNNIARGGIPIASPSGKAKEENFNFVAGSSKSKTDDGGAKRKKGVSNVPQNNNVNSNNNNTTTAPKKKKSKPSSEKTGGVPASDPASVCIALGKDKSRTCKSKALSGLQYCWHHAPLDPNSGFIFCQYTDPTKKATKKCNIPVPKSKSIPYCNYHEKLIIPRRQKQQAPPENADVSVEDELVEGNDYNADDFEDDSGIGIGADEEEEGSEEEEANIVDDDELDGDDGLINPL